METAAKLFARRVLYMHLLLLAIVLAGVVVASKEIYDRSRDRVIEQATLRQMLLANETARGIQNYYQSILENLDLLHRAEGEEPATRSSEAPGPPAVAAVTAAERARRATLYGGSLRAPLSPEERNLLLARTYDVLWRQLRGRVSLLFFYDRTAALRKMPAVLLIGRDESAPPPQAIVDANLAVIESLRAPAISPFQAGFGAVASVPSVASTPSTASNSGGTAESVATDGGANVLFIQYPRGRVLVAVVPVAPVQTTFVRSLNDDPDQGSAWLADEKLTVMAGSPSEVIGRMIGATAAMPNQLQNGTEVTAAGFTVGSMSFPPALLTTQTLTVVNRRWALFVAQPLEQIDSAVAKLLNRALLWAAFVVLSVTGILASTAWQLIRSRVRLERFRHELLTKEMTQARQIQMAWLPVKPPEMPPVSGGCGLTVDLAAINTPASHISGDFYNWFPLPDGKLVVTIGDVTGHGMSAAFLMATTQLLVRTTMPRVLDPAKCLTEVNQQLCVQAFNGQFVTMLICVLDLARCELNLANAGHPAPLVASAEQGCFHPLAVEPQLVLGVDRSITFTPQRFPLDRDAQILLYTDGVIECANPAGDRFGADRLHRGWTPPPPTAQNLLDGVLARVDTFRGPRELSDDLTLVSLRLCSATS